MPPSPGQRKHALNRRAYSMKGAGIHGILHDDGGFDMKTRFRRSGKTSREIRRMGERERTRERRQEAIQAFWRLTPEERQQRIADNEAFKRISRNGITIEDMHKAESDAYQQGIRDGKDATVRTCFAAICLALHELHGFGSKRCSRVLNAVYDKLLFTLTSQDAIQDVYNTIGLEISFDGDVTEDAVTEKGA